MSYKINEVIGIIILQQYCEQLPNIFNVNHLQTKSEQSTSTKIHRYISTNVLQYIQTKNKQFIPIKIQKSISTNT